MSVLVRTRTQSFLIGIAPIVWKLARAAGRAALRPAKSLRARRALQRLSELSDHELKDIVLVRSDLADAAAAGLSRDPTEVLARTAAERARARRAQASELSRWARNR